MENKLSKAGLWWYRALRMALVLAFLGTAVFVAIKTVFPNGGGYFDFRSYGSGKNTLADPRYEDGAPVAKGALKQETVMLVNASASGDFSRVDIFFSGERVGGDIGRVSLKQAYRAYLYPVGEPVVCPREGSLIASQEKYGIVSKGKVRWFASLEEVRARGYALDQFAVFSPESMAGCPRGESISVRERAIPGMIIATDEGHFQLLEDEWAPFVSDSAFESRYRREDAVVPMTFPPVQVQCLPNIKCESVAVSPEMLTLYPVRENPLGFADGTLVSYGESVYAVEGETLRPIDSVDTFLAKGYAWEEVKALTGEEFGMYTRGKLYTKREPHPNGTLFSEEKTDTMYVVEGGTKRAIVFPELRAQFDGVKALPASVVDLGECTVTDRLLSFGCRIDWAGKERGVGAEYELTYTAQSPVTLASLEVVFSREKNARNWGLFVAETMGKLQSRYPIGL